MRLASSDGRGLVRIDHESSPTVESFAKFVRQLQPREAVGCFLGLLHQRESMQQLPLKFLHHHARIGLEQAKGRVKKVPPVVDFALRVLFYTPATLRALMYELLKEASQNLGLLQDFQLALLSQAKKYPHERRLTTALFALGVSEVGKDSWKHAFDQSLRRETATSEEEIAHSVTAPMDAENRSKDAENVLPHEDQTHSMNEGGGEPSLSSPALSPLTPLSQPSAPVTVPSSEEANELSLSSPTQVRDDADWGDEAAEEAARAMIEERRSQFHNLGPAEVELGSALPELAGKLYSKDVHFILELVQNADDNTYATDVAPTLNLVITNSEIRIENNEVRTVVISSQNIVLGTFV